MMEKNKKKLIIPTVLVIFAAMILIWILRGSSSEGNNRIASKNIEEYTFSFSGGSGRVEIACEKLEKEDDQVYATIFFSKKNGGESHYDAVKTDGETYTGENRFRIPVELNKNMTIEAETQAMSQAHWISYEILITVDEKDEGGQKTELEKNLSETRGVFDDRAPEVQGLEAADTEAVQKSELLRVFSYKNGFMLIELDMAKYTWRDTEEYGKWEEEQKASDSDAQGTAGQDVADDNETYSAEDSISGIIGKLYTEKVVKYLIVPENAEIPAGLDQELLIIRQGLQRAYVSSEDAYEILEKLGKTDIVSCYGFAEDSEIRDRLPQKAVFAGTYDNWDLKEMILAKTQIALEAEALISEETAGEERTLDLLQKYGTRAAQMDMVLWIDRSAEEAEAADVWEYVYQLILA